MARGRPSTPLLTRGRIIEAAFAVVDAKGSLSLGAVARQLDVHVSSLYNHVNDRQHLLELMRDAMFDAQPFDGFEGLDWVGALRAVGRLMYGAFVSQPKLVPEIAHSPVDSPDALAGYAIMAELLLSAGLDELRISIALKALDALAIGSALEHGAITSAWPENLPGGAALAAAARTWRDEGARADAAFEFGLEAIIAGVAKELATRD